MMGSKKEVTVRMKVDTREIDSALEKLSKLRSQLEKANSLADELAPGKIRGITVEISGD